LLDAEEVAIHGDEFLGVRFMEAIRAETGDGVEPAKPITCAQSEVLKAVRKGGKPIKPSQIVMACP
jgi:hypothetical protein